ncbi:hypothetical protein FQR65_LT04922 [Abscondita terminalis]|nr:hypothetical protein FQR65_LT04922 [Abscondita terminalis]
MGDEEKVEPEKKEEPEKKDKAEKKEDTEKKGELEPERKEEVTKKEDLEKKEGGDAKEEIRAREEAETEKEKDTKSKSKPVKKDDTEKKEESETLEERKYEGEEDKFEETDEKGDAIMLAEVTQAVAKKKGRGGPTKAETLKEKLTNAKETRSIRISSITNSQRYICDLIATLWDIETNDVIDAFGDSQDHVDILNSFCDAKGTFAVLFLQQLGPAYELSTGRSNPTETQDVKITRIYITKGDSMPILGKGIIVYRLSNSKYLDVKTITETLFYTQFYMSESNNNIVSALYNVMKNVFTPAIQVSKEWGDLNKTEAGLQIKSEFMGDYTSFYNYMDKTKIDIDELVKFETNDELAGLIDTPEKIAEGVRNPEVSIKVMTLFRHWLVTIEKIVTQFHQIRREDEFVGPVVEVEYWRKQLSKFTSIVQFCQSDVCQTFIAFATKARHRLLKIWKLQDVKVINARNECIDNVKYLHALEKYCQPLYRVDPTQMPQHLPKLLEAVRMVCTTSRYYNNTSSITAIMVKVSNQMVIMCKNYLTCQGTETVWSQKKQVVLDKIKVCLDLYLKYYQCFTQCQNTMRIAGEQPFECSKIYVFGKLETFKIRLERIVDVLQRTIKYSILQSSTIEGIEVFANKFIDFHKKISTKKYDALNHRQEMFDNDYVEFRKSIANAEYNLEEFVGNSLEKMENVDNVLRLLKRFDKLGFSCLHLEERYLEAFEMFQTEIEELRDLYNEERQDPQIPRNMPPVSGRIMWIRQLYSRIELPMKEFLKHDRVMRHRKSQKCIQLYNSLSCVLIHYEQIYHEAWSKYVTQVRQVLNTPILIVNPQTKRFIVNFNVYILEAIQESENMYKLDLSVPDAAQILLFSKKKILHSWEVVKQLVQKNDEIRKNMNVLFFNLLRPKVLEMQMAFLPGFSTITWICTKIPEFCEQITTVLEAIDLFLKKAADVKEARIDEVLDGITHTNLLYSPPKPLYPDVLEQECLNFDVHKTEELKIKLTAAERSVVTLVNMFVESMNHPNIQEEKYNWLDSSKVLKQITSSANLKEDAAFRDVDVRLLADIDVIHNDCMDLYAYFNSKVIEALVKCTTLTLETLKDRFSIQPGTNTSPYPPMLRTKMKLHIPTAIIEPNLNDIQRHFFNILENILNVHKDIQIWGHTEPDEEGSIPNYYRSVSEHKEVVRAYMNIQSVSYLLTPGLNKLIQEYLRYSYLWAEDREDQIQEFCDGNPLPVEIENCFRKYEDRSEEVRDLEDENIIGTLSIDMEEFKLALLVEADAWKYALGKKLCIKYKEKLTEVVDFIKAREKVLGRVISNLDDCRIGMNCLQQVREYFINMDLLLQELEEVYGILTNHDIDIPKEDADRIDSLRLNFQNMIEHAKVQAAIVEIQGPLLEELLAGVKVLSEDVTAFDIDFELNGPLIPGLHAREASDRVLLFQARFDDLWAKFENYATGEALFGLPPSDYPILHKRKKEFVLLNRLYGLYLQVNMTIDGYFDLLWSEVDIETMTAEITEFQNRCRKMPKALKDWPAYNDLKNKIDDFNSTCPLLELMSNKAMKERHWIRISKVTNYNFPIESPTFSLRDVMAAPLLKYNDDVEDICISAVKEKDIEAKLKQVIADWAIIDVTFANFKNRGELLLKGNDTLEIIASVEDSLMILTSLLSNRYNAPFKKDIQNTVNRLVTTSEVLEKWMFVQNLWVYLEAVFAGGDIARQLPSEAKRFQAIDKAWIRIMYRAHDILNVVEICASDETMTTLLPFLMDQLESCQKSLSGYLEAKRLCFPRFFFISDPVLLEIMGQSSDPHTIQPHLLSLFDAVCSVNPFHRCSYIYLLKLLQVVFDEKKHEEAIAMVSDLGEEVAFEKRVVCHGGVEIWLGKLLQAVRDTVRGVIAAQALTMADPGYNFVTDFVTSCGQAGLVGVQLLWTKDAEHAIKRSRVDRAIMRNTNQSFLILLNDLIDLTSKDLSKIQRIRYETMVTIHVHQRDIFDDMVTLKVKTLTDFEWQKQARFYFDEETDDCIVKITDVIFTYQNEYLGITERLAITPLTDRCYITLAQAIWMNMGGAPAGPAGTGKTETTKDMGRTLGKFVVVFNCSDQMDFRGLGRIFKGLAQSGSWGCFDEFNRIELPVLSVAAQQIYILLSARKARKPSFIFSDGDTVMMNMEFGIFLTMNPGYAGRQELPENLKIMFRNVAMMVPDRQIIMRVKLASCGFKDNVILSKKFFTLYKLCEEQLSKQVHYDFGLRNILSVLRTLGAQKRMNPNDTEETIVMRVLRDMNLSKLVDEDEPLFLSLIDDMFPGIKLTAHSWKELQKAIANQTALMGIINWPSWNLKVVQLYETYLVRHGLMVLGPTGAGKTKCMHILMKAMTENGLPTKEMRMNPKAITAPQMFGKLDVATNDWTDGIFSTLWRRTHKVNKAKFTWLVLDGPVDAIWIENLNSVLDDNKTLTLANGDRIIMAANSKIVFEPDNVDNASPATISRMGMVFMSASVLPWPPILDAWLKKKPQAEADTLKSFFYKNYDDLHNFMQVKLKPKMAIREALYIRQCCEILEGLMISEDDANPNAFTDRHLERLYLFAVMWSIGAVLELDDRSKLEEFALTKTVKMDWPKCHGDDSIFEFVVNSDGRWEHWRDRTEPFYYPNDTVLEFNTILVPNVDNTRTAFLIDIVAKQGKAVLLIGEQGTAKTVMIKGYLNMFDPDFKLNKSFNFSSETTPNMVQRIIESYIDKRVGTTFGPPAGKTLTIFIDDINMPVINAWGDQITNEIVRQIMEMGGMYSLDKPGDFLSIVDVRFVAAMIHPGGGRNDIPHRLKRHYCVFNCTLPSINSMDMIFKQIAEGYFCTTRFTTDIVEFIPRLVPLTRHVWAQTKVKMLPTPAKFHYVFNLRDLSRIWQGILTVQDLECRTRKSLLKLWQHECTRVISDRFVNQNDRNWFINNLRKQALTELGEYATEFPEEETYWVDYLRDAPEATGDEPDDFSFEPPKIYEEIPSWDFIKEKLIIFMETYNEEVRGAKMDMVFFLDAMIHLNIISRIIRTPRGNAMLVGVGGSGKQTLTKLASFIAGYSHFQISLTRSYNLNNFMDDMKFLYRTSGFDGHGISFIFTDNDIKEETFLESLNNVLSSGEIANLFPKDELDEITTELIPVMKKVAPKKIPTNDILYDFFITRARSNLHIVLCFSPVSAKFRSRAMKFPGLISGCTMDWFSKWPTDALIAVSNHFLGDYKVVATPEVKQNQIIVMAIIQETVSEMCSSYFDRFRRQTYVTPKTFLSFLDSYRVLYKASFDGIEVLASRMRNGLHKLIEAAESVDILRKELEIKEQEITAANAAAEKALPIE